MFCLLFHLIETASHCTPDSAGPSARQTLGILLSLSPHRGYTCLQPQTYLYGCSTLQSESFLKPRVYSTFTRSPPNIIWTDMAEHNNKTLYRLVNPALRRLK